MERETQGDHKTACMHMRYLFVVCGGECISVSLLVSLNNEVCVLRVSIATPKGPLKEEVVSSQFVLALQEREFPSGLELFQLFVREIPDCLLDSFHVFTEARPQGLEVGHGREHDTALVAADVQVNRVQLLLKRKKKEANNSDQRKDTPDDSRLRPMTAAQGDPGGNWGVEQVKILDTTRIRVPERTIVLSYISSSRETNSN